MVRRETRPRGRANREPVKCFGDSWSPSGGKDKDLTKGSEKELCEKHKETGREGENVITEGFLVSLLGEKNPNCLYLSPCGRTCWCIKILLGLYPGSLLLEISKAGWLWTRYTCSPSRQSNQVIRWHEQAGTANPTRHTTLINRGSPALAASLVFWDKLPHSSPPQLPSCTRRVTTPCPQLSRFTSMWGCELRLAHKVPGAPQRK